MSLRTMIVSLFGALVLAFGSGALQAPAAAAAPDRPSVTQIADFPFDGLGADDAPSKEGTPTKDDKADKAEKLGGGVTTKIIDLITGIIKCGLNIATPSVKCQL
ncbi:hypothetical protein [Nocardia sp. NBC_01009]|uniref:hypothetical protein n=1 Tax=Nocardia sp. NBC_01009 TaxID=2975996 RepID=UPI00386AEB96|nr:hypothetical protein OHA42_35510 [Nocardia sp. NBC_01009]